MRPPASAAISTSRATIADSAWHGLPSSPSRVATTPSFRSPASDSSGSSSCSISGRSNFLAYSSARRRIADDTIGLPSSDSATAPPVCNSPNSVSCRPSWRTVTAPTGHRLIRSSRRASRRRNSMSARESDTGLVLGIGQTPVKPPASAARRPLSIVSLYSKPGCRRWTCTSIRPGSTSLPRASITSAPAAAAAADSPAPSWRTRPSAASRSSRAFTPLAGSTSRPPRTRTGCTVTPPPSRPLPGRRRRRRRRRRPARASTWCGTAPPCAPPPRWSPGPE